MKWFVYDVNGSVFESSEPFGEAWLKAKEVARAEHVGIFRQVVNTVTGEIRNEFYAVGGVFLNERFYEVSKLYIF